MKIAVKSLSNQKVKDVDLPEAVFDYPFKEHLVHLAVQSYLAAQRSGSAKTKERGEVRGSRSKLYRQKGTGRARAGSITSPLRRSGGTVHGPRPKSWADKLTPREKRNALKSALARKLRDEGIVVLDSLELENAKTGDLDRALKALGIDGKALLVDGHDNDNLALAARNNPRLKAVDALAVNVYDVVDRASVVFSEGALDRLVGVLSK